MKNLSEEMIQQAGLWFEAGKGVALATVIKTWGSAPRPAGSKMLISSAGEMAGSVSGGCVETATIEVALRVIAGGKAERIAFGVSSEQAWEVGLACGGSIEILVEKLEAGDLEAGSAGGALPPLRQAALLTVIESRAADFGRNFLIANGKMIEPAGAHDALASAVAAAAGTLAGRKAPFCDEIAGRECFIEPILPPARLLIVGGVHIAIPLAAFARHVGFEVVLIDPRQSFANRSRFPNVDRIINEWPDTAIEKLEPGENCFVVVLSHDPKIDDPALLSALKFTPEYIGALGSRRTHAKRRERLQYAGASAQDLDKLHSPIGLPIGAITPEEIALSILAQITAVRRGA